MKTTHKPSADALSKIEAAKRRVRVSNVRTCRGDEGDAFSCDLAFDTDGDGVFTDAATVTYDGNGGCYDVRRLWDRKLDCPRNPATHRAMMEWASGLREITGWDSIEATLPYDIDILIEDAMNDEGHRKTCRTKIVIRSGVVVRVSTLAPTKSNVAKIKAAYPDFECLNERFDMVLPDEAGDDLARGRWRASCARFGFEVADLGRSFKDLRGVVHVITDIAPRRQRSILTTSGGRNYSWAPESVRTLLARSPKEAR